MFIFSRVNFLFCFLILVKVIIAVTKGIYSIILKICNEIEFTLNCGKNYHFSQTVRRRSEMDSFVKPDLSSKRSRTSNFVNGSHHSPSVDFMIYNLHMGRKITVRHLGNEVVTNASEIACDKPENFQQDMTVQETCHLVPLEPRKTFDGDIPGTSLDCSSLNRVCIASQGTSDPNQEKVFANFPENLRNSQNAEERSSTRVLAKASEGSSYLQMQIIDKNTKTLFNKSNRNKNEISELDQSIKLEENKGILSNETQYFKDKELNPEPHIVKSNEYNFNSNATDYSLDESEIDCQKGEYNSKRFEDREHIVAETNEEEYSTYTKDEGRFTSEMDNSKETKGSSHSFYNNEKTVEFQGKEVLLETSKSKNSKIQCVDDTCNIKCSEDLMKDEVCNVETFHGSENVLTQALLSSVDSRIEKSTENAQSDLIKGGNLSKSIHINTITPSATSIPEASSKVQKCDDTAAADTFIELKPIFCTLEDIILSWCKRTIDMSESAKQSNAVEFIYKYFDLLMAKTKIMSGTNYYTHIVSYINEMKFTFTQTRSELMHCSTCVNENKVSAYLDEIRSRFVNAREIMFSNIAELNEDFTIEKEITKTRISRKSKSKNKRRRK